MGLALGRPYPNSVAGPPSSPLFNTLELGMGMARAQSVLFVPCLALMHDWFLVSSPLASLEYTSLHEHKS